MNLLRRSGTAISPAPAN